jgi:hypothetical protein
MPRVIGAVTWAHRAAVSEKGSYVRSTPGSAARGPDPEDPVK